MADWIAVLASFEIGVCLPVAASLILSDVTVSEIDVSLPEVAFQLLFVLTLSEIDAPLPVVACPLPSGLADTGVSVLRSLMVTSLLHPGSAGTDLSELLAPMMVMRQDVSLP